MKLDEYLEKNNISPEKFAYDLNCSRSTVFYWIAGVYKPHVLYMKMIEEYTKGAVTKKDFEKKKRRKDND